MSNFLAIATVTATLSRNLQTAAGQDVQNTIVTTLKPDSNGGLPTTGVNIFLYQVTPNANWRNSDLPTRRSGGELIQRPRAALDLHYLLTFYGDDSQLEQQRLLGSVVRTLHAQSILTRKQIQDTIGDPQFNSFLVGSNLADEIELVRFTPLPLSLEELSKLWSVFFQIPYALSIAYMATVVLIESGETPQTALPVREPKVYAIPFRYPTITAVEPQIIEFSVGARVTVRGNNLQANKTSVQFNQLDGTIELPLQSDRLVVTLPAMVRAGINAVQIIQPLQLGVPPTDHPGFESNIAALVIQPQLKSAKFEPTASGPRITVTTTPVIGAKQQVYLLLNLLADPTPPSPLAYTLQARPRAVDADPLVFDATGVHSGTYLVRVRVDGADSNLIQDTDPSHTTTFNKYIGPTMVVP